MDPPSFWARLSARHSNPAKTSCAYVAVSRAVRSRGFKETETFRTSESRTPCNPRKIPTKHCRSSAVLPSRQPVTGATSSPSSSAAASLSAGGLAGVRYHLKSPSRRRVSSTRHCSLLLSDPGGKAPANRRSARQVRERNARHASSAESNSCLTPAFSESRTCGSSLRTASSSDVTMRATQAEATRGVGSLQA